MAQAHAEIINAIDGVGGLGVGEGAPEIVTGSRDGVVKVWDPRQSTPVASVEPADGEEKVMEGFGPHFLSTWRVFRNEETIFGPRVKFQFRLFGCHIASLTK